MKRLLLIATVLASTVAAQVFQKGNVLSPVATLQMAAPEISAYMPEKKMLFVVGGDKLIEMVSFADEKNPKVESRLQLDGPATSVTVFGDLVAISMTAEPEHGLGQVQLFRYAEGLIPSRGISPKALPPARHGDLYPRRQQDSRGLRRHAQRGL